MIVQNAYSYIQVGLWLRHLRNTEKTDTAKAMLVRINSLSSCMKEVGLEVSLNYTKSVSYGEMLAKLRALGDDEAIGPDISGRIVSIYTTIEEVVFSESGIKQIYVVPQRRFNNAYLLSDASKLLKDGAFDKLDVIARTDIASACRCIAFGEGTAAAFHIIRATEATLKAYYFHHRKQKRLSKPMWANMLDQLKQKKKGKPPAALLASLDLIRESYRNPTQHPEATYEIDAAQDLLGVCLDVIGKMAGEL